MSEQIRSWPDALFYYSAASTANVREQLIKLQQATKRLRALSDASTVNTNGDVLQDILTGVSFGNSTQRHKYRALYDTSNDRYIIQRNSGTDASKTWVELLRIDSSGNVTTTGTLSTDALTTTAGGITLGGNLDMNQFYIRNLEKINGRTRTDILEVHDGTTLRSTLAVTGAVTMASTLAVTGATTLTGATTVQGTDFFDIGYYENSANQLISAATLTDITDLTEKTLPNTAATLTSRKFLVRFNIQYVNTSGAAVFVFVNAYNGANGNKSDTVVFTQPMTMDAGAIFGDFLCGEFRFSPGASNRTKLGLAVQSSGTITLGGSASAGRCTMTIQEVP